ncbi:MAG: DUF262 domain-containing protein [Synergistaceae bacterium]|nr:DUF262 domain-containing protein [Synergistaceae bacterium]
MKKLPKLETKDKTVKQLFEDNRTHFLIPDYQRPYEWDDKECGTLWTDLYTFAFPDNEPEKFDWDNNEYFLGPIVTFTNENSAKEVIDGQQRLTTLMLLLRAFYTEFEKKQDKNSIKARDQIGACIWKTDEIDDTPDMASCKLETEVATDEAKEDFKEILKTGAISKDKKSRYANNYRFFQNKITEFLQKYDGYLAHFSARILKNCIILDILASSSEAAMRIFTTLNDRGKPLSDADIFKSQLYKYYKELENKDKFIKRWKELEEVSSEIYHPIVGTPMDEAFTRYMYYERARQENKSSTIEALRKFYEKNSYALLKNGATFDNIVDLANFWKSVSLQDKERFSDKILKRLFVLNYAPNGMWTYITSVYYIRNRSENGLLDEEKFYDFLNKITAFIWGYSFINPGVNALRTPIYAEMVNIVDDKRVEFKEYKIDLNQLENAIKNYVFTNTRTITKSMLAWWAFNDENQELLELNKSFQIEHIYAKKRLEFDRSFSNPRNIELLGNKALLEGNINIRASDYHFADKVKYYKGFKNSRGQSIGGTSIKELQDLAKNAKDFTENDIVQRNALIVQKFIEYLRKNDLLK